MFARLLWHILGCALYIYIRRTEIGTRREYLSCVSWTTASLYFSRRLHHRDDYRLIFWLWENDYTAETIRDKPGWTYVKKNGTTTAQVVRLHGHLPPSPSPIPDPWPALLSTVRGLGGKSGETLKGFTGLRTLDSPLGSAREVRAKLSARLRRKKKVNERKRGRERERRARSIPLSSLNFRYAPRNIRVETSVRVATRCYFLSAPETRSLYA